MSRVALAVLLSVWALMAGAGELPPTRATDQAVQQNASTPASGAARKGLKSTDRSRSGVPQASKKPPAPLLFLNEKNLGLGCAQPS